MFGCFGNGRWRAPGVRRSGYQVALDAVNDHEVRKRPVAGGVNQAAALRAKLKHRDLTGGYA
jgi:hypothetical protein